MKVGLSFLSPVRSFLGIQFGHGGHLEKREGKPMLIRTMDLELGFVFGWITLSFNTGRNIDLEEINESLREEVLKGKKIG
jgi:hypothetical protein